MSFWEWLFKQTPQVQQGWWMSQQNCMETKKDGGIEVIEPVTPDEHRLCIFGGQLHCVHGSGNCCFCKFKKRQLRRMN